MAQRATYDDDFYNWTQEQAALLRDLPRAVTLPNAIDLAHIAEEIEDMGKSELNRVKSNWVQMMVHLIKLAVHGLDAQPAEHWIDEILAFRLRARTHFTPGMRQLIELSALWHDATMEAADKLALRNEALPDLPEFCPFSLDELLAERIDLKAILARLRPDDRPDREH